MSADDQTPNPADDQTPPAGTEPQGGGDNDQDQPKGRQARRDEQARQRAAELETERDALAARVEALQTREVEAIAANTLAQPGDLLALSGHQLADFLDENGEVDPGAVAAALDQLIESRPGLHKGATPPRGHHDWGHSRTNGAYAPGGGGSKSWAEAFGAAGREGMQYT